MIQLFDSPIPIATRARQTLGNLQDPEVARIVLGDSLGADKALTVPAVWRATELIARRLSTLPLFAYQRVARGGKEPIPDDPLYSLVHDDCNDDLSMSSFIEWGMIQILLRGNAYAEVGRNALGDAVALWPITNPVTPMFDLPTGNLFYRVHQPDGPVDLDPSEIFHVPGYLLDNPYVGISVIDKARRNLDLSIRQERFAASFYENAGVVGGVVTLPVGEKDKERIEFIRKQVNDEHQGERKAFRNLLLHSGMTFTARETLKQSDQQWIEGRAFSVYDVARWYGLRPSFLMVEGATSYASQEQDAEQLIVETLAPWAEKWETEFRRKLVPVHRRRSTVIEFAIDAIVRGNLAERANAYSVMLNAGIVTANECRSKENLPALPGGDVLRQPLNVIEAGRATEFLFAGRPKAQPKPEVTPEPGESEEPTTAARTAAVIVLTRTTTRMGSTFRQRIAKIDEVEKRDAFTAEYRTKFASEVRPIVEMTGAKDIDGAIDTLWSEIAA